MTFCPWRSCLSYCRLPLSVFGDHDCLLPQVLAENLFVDVDKIVIEYSEQDGEFLRMQVCIWE
jgi:hypothetical protein